ncbi:uncharacterized protein BYT42DRAFT_576015 [Radiomyces spectabilis]|uniref:uncharacterized protein n=1 Tax=Radiomyces spectabilis TaxID=64574 RepID=UPI00221FD8F8|nr:uncharacterized protein BYT42DRAFT_576015 [Radiomyces spectabilis]KAI8374343.1 hypothetical protein BYT42DRAFT_576015 [Radiomyces spectabilis]
MTLDHHAPIVNLEKPDSTSMTMLAWSQRQLQSYVDLSLIHPIRDLCQAWQDGAAFLCLAHRFCPETVPNLVSIIHDKDPQRNLATAFRLLQDRFQVSPCVSMDTLDSDTITAYLGQLREVIDREDYSCQVQILTNPTYQEMPDEFENRAAFVSNKISQLQHDLTQLISLGSRSIRDSDTSTRSNATLHPVPSSSTRSSSLNDTPDDHHVGNSQHDVTNDLNPSVDEKVAQAPSAPLQDDLATLTQFETDLSTLENKDLPELHAYVQSMPEEMRHHPTVCARMQAIEVAHTAFDLQLQKGAAELDAYRSHLIFSHIFAPIRNDLEFIQAKMLKTTTTDLGIQDLEERAHNAGLVIDRIRSQHVDLLTSSRAEDRAYRAHFDVLVQKYKLICSWVDDVRIWFVEAERIRQWIEQRIEHLEAKGALDALNEVEFEFTMEQVDHLNSEHEMLEKEVEEFDKEDMTRLRAHVKALTGTERENKDLSPADTTTIEITFTTLMTLDRLIHLLRRRSYDLQILTLRMFWEQEYIKSIEWVRYTQTEIKEFVQGKARWRSEGPKGGAIEETEVMEQTASELKEHIIGLLIDLEQRIAAFDQGQFTTTVNVYQDMDDSSNVELPNHLESRQVALEEAFEDVILRIAFARTVVEQRLSVTDFVYRADALKANGEMIRQAIVTAESNADADATDTEFTRQVQLFQEQALQLVTEAATRIIYTETSQPSEQKANAEANDNIRSVIDARTSALVLFGEALDHKLASYRHVLQVHKRKQQIQQDMHRFDTWMDERLETVNRFKVDLFVGKCTLDDTDLARLQKIRDDHQSKVKAVKHTDFPKLQDSIMWLQEAVSSAHIVNIDVGTFEEEFERLQAKLALLESLLDYHTAALAVLQLRIDWERRHSKASQWVVTTTRKLWDLITTRAQWQPSMIEKTVDNNDWSRTMEDFADMQRKFSDFEGNQLTRLNQAFVSFMQSLKDIVDNHSHVQNDADTHSIEHVQRRQDILHESIGHFSESMAYAQAVIDQHVAITQFVEKVRELESSGQQILQDIKMAFDRITTEADASDFDNVIQQYGDIIHELWMQSGCELPYPVCTPSARTNCPLDEEDNVHEEIRAVTLQQYDQLLHLSREMHSLNEEYKRATYLHAEFQRCLERTADTEVEVARIRTKLSTNDLAHSITTCMNISVPDEMTITETMNRYDSIFKAMNEILEMNLPGLIQQIDTLEEAVLQSDCGLYVDIAQLKDGSNQLQMHAEEVVCLMTLRKEELAIYKTTIAWKRPWLQTYEVMDELTDDVHSFDTLLGTQSKEFSSSRCDFKEAVEKLQIENRQIEKRFVALESTEFQTAQSTYNELVCIVNDASDKKFAHDLEELQSSLKKSMDELRNRLSSQTQHLHALNRRLTIENRLHGCLQLFSEAGDRIEKFIAEHGRGSMRSKTDEAAKEFNDPLNLLHSEATAAIDRNQEVLDQVAQDEMVWCDSTRELQTAVETNMEILREHLAFAKAVMDQRVILAQYLEAIERLEQKGEDIKAKILNAESTDTDIDQEVDGYANEIDHAIRQQDICITYPVRSFSGYEPASRELDERSNASIQGMIHARQARLQEMLVSVQSILESKKRLSRRKAIEAAYYAEATVVQQWIVTKKEELERAMARIGSPTFAVDCEVLDSVCTNVRSIESALTTYSAAYTSLKSLIPKAQTMIENDAFEGDEKSLAEADVDNMQVEQGKIDHLWCELQDNVQSSQQTLSILQRTSEFMKSVDSVRIQCASIRESLDEPQCPNMDNDHLRQCREKLQKMRTETIERLQAQLVDEKRKQDQHQSDAASSSAIQEMQDALADIEGLSRDILQFIETTHARFSVLHRQRQCRELLQKLEAFVGETMNLLQTTRDEQLRKIEIESTDCNQLLKTCNSVNRSIDDYIKLLDEQRLLVRWMHEHDVDDMQAIDQESEKLKHGWDELLQNLFDTRRWAATVGQWYDLQALLDQIQRENVVALQQKLSTVDVTAKDSGKSLNDLSTELQLVHAKLERATMTADSIQSGIEDYDEPHRLHFKDWLDGISATLGNLKEALSMKEKEREVFIWHQGYRQWLLAIQETAQQLDQSSSERVAAIREYTLKQDAGTLYRKQATLFGTAETTYKDVCEQFVNRDQRKKDQESANLETDDNAIEKSVEETLASLQNRLHVEETVMDVMRRFVGLSKSKSDIVLWIDNCSKVIDDLSKDEMMDEAEMLQELHDVETKIAGFDKTVHSFEGMYQTLQDTISDIDTKHETSSMAIAHLQDLATMQLQETKDYWKKVNTLLDNLKVQTTKTQFQLNIVRKFKHITLLLGETRDQLSNLIIFDDRDTAISPHQLLRLLRESEVKPLAKSLDTIDSHNTEKLMNDIRELDEMLDALEDDKTFIQQRAEVEAAMASLLQSIADKQQQVTRGLTIGRYLAVTDNTEVLLSSLEEAIEKAAPYRATMIGSNFSKADLQAKRIELDARYKYYERKITESLEAATHEGSLVDAEDGYHQAISKQLDELHQRWHTVQSQVKARKTELIHIMESAAEQDTTKKIRIRKSSLPTRKASSFLRDRDVSSPSRLTPTSSTSSTRTTPSVSSKLVPSSLSSGIPGNGRVLSSRYLSPASTHRKQQASKSATSLKPPAIHGPQTPPNSYVADPDNDLDIEIGRIVNEAPYRVKVKMVPGEVGRYWFGDANPKLCYCRVLKSKMVMVRVGGGWTELSQFLRDHALLEGDFIPKSRRNFGEEKKTQQKPPTIQEGFIETRRAQLPSGRPMPRSHRSTSPNPPVDSSRSTPPHLQTGYKDGDRFIAMDRHGNQLEVKMTKFDVGHVSEVTKRRLARRKDMAKDIQ